MKTITKPYLNNRECSVQEAFYNILPKLKLRKIFRVVYFISTNTPEERAQVLLLKKNLANYQTVFQILSRNQILMENNNEECSYPPPPPKKKKIKIVISGEIMRYSEETNPSISRAK